MCLVRRRGVFLYFYLLSLCGLHVVQFLRYLYLLFQFSNQTWACHKYHSSKFLDCDYENLCPTLLYKKKIKINKKKK